MPPTASAIRIRQAWIFMMRQSVVSTFSLLIVNFSEDFTFVEENKDCVWSHLTANRRVHTPDHTDH